MSAPLPPGRLPVFGWLCVVFGVGLLGAAVLASVIFVRGTVERSKYASAALCLDEPVVDCWVEVSATVAGKRVDNRSVLVDDHVLELNKAPDITLADGSGLWDALEPGEPVTLRLWHGHVVHASAEGHEADTIDHPRVGTQRLYAFSLVAFGMGGLLIIAGFGWLGARRGERKILARRQAVLQWAGRFALGAAFVGVVGLCAEIYTRAAPLPVVTALGVAGVVAVGGVVRLARARLVREHVAA